MGFTAGGVFIAIVLALLWWAVAPAEAHDVVYVEQNKYKIKTAHHNDLGSSALQDMHLIWNTPVTPMVVVSIPEATRVNWCEDNNRILTALEEYTNNAIAAAPEHAELYDSAVEAIDNAWCEQ